MPMIIPSILKSEFFNFSFRNSKTGIFRLFIPPGVGQGAPEYFGQAPWAAYYPVEEPQAPYMSFDSRMKVLVDQVEYYFSDANLAKGKFSCFLHNRV